MAQHLNGTNYPKYRMSQWIDTSEEAMEKPQATIIYGIQTKREKGGLWMHCMTSTGPMQYDTHGKASEAIQALRESDTEAVGAGQQPAISNT